MQLPKFATDATDLSVLEVLLELLQHDSKFLGLHPAVGQQHAAELPLRDPPSHWVMPLKLEGGKKKKEGSENKTMQQKAPSRVRAYEGTVTKNEHCRKHS